MSDNPSYRAAREMIEQSCPSDVKAQIHEVTDKWKDAMPNDDEFGFAEFEAMMERRTARTSLRRSIERQARAWAFWRGVLWGAVFGGAGVWYLLKGLVGG